MKSEIIFAESTTGKTTALKTVPHIVDLDTLWEFWVRAKHLDGWKAVKDPSAFAEFRRDAEPALLALAKSGNTLLIWDVVLADKVAQKLGTKVRAYVIADGNEYAKRTLERFNRGEKSIPSTGLPSKDSLIRNHEKTLAEVRKHNWNVVQLKEGQYLSDFLRNENVNSLQTTTQQKED